MRDQGDAISAAFPRPGRFLKAVLIVMGALDDNDGLDFRDGWDSLAAAQVDRLFGSAPRDRWGPSQLLYLSVGATARFVLVPGISHDRKALQPLSTAFFAEQLSQQRTQLR